jgi:hypothetical protein
MSQKMILFKETIVGTPSAGRTLSVHCVTIISLGIITILLHTENLQKVWNIVASNHSLLLAWIRYDAVVIPP